MAHRVTGRIRIWTLLAISFLAPLQLAAASAEPAAGGPAIEPLERGQHIARAVATVTGTAISPLFGVPVLGHVGKLKRSVGGNPEGFSQLGPPAELRRIRGGPGLLLPMCALAR